jgi:D-alanyl-D-alanine carboxypeptidase
MSDGRADIDHRHFEALLTALIGADGVHSAVVRLEAPDGGLIWAGALGQARADRDAAMATNDLFHIASVTKAMTAAIVLKLCEDGRMGALGLDTPLSQIGVFGADIIRRLHGLAGRDQSHALTLRRLLTHTSGLRDAMIDDATTLGGPAPNSLIGRSFRSGDASRRWDPWDPTRPDDAEAGVINFFLNSGIADAALWPPGAAFHYSDTGFMLLGVVAEHLGEAPLHHLFRRHIFDPLNMTSSYLAYRDDPADLGPRRAPESDVWNGEIPMLSDGVSLSFDWAGGGVVSTASDLARFLRGLLSGALFISSATLADMTTFLTPEGLQAPRTGVGLGLFRIAYPGGALIGHSGAWGVGMFQDVDTGVVVTGTVNQSQAPAKWQWPFLAAAQAIIRRDAR